MLANISGSLDQELLLRIEYFVTENRTRSVKDELLSKMILFGDGSLRHCREAAKRAEIGNPATEVPSVRPIHAEVVARAGAALLRGFACESLRVVPVGKRAIMASTRLQP